jgi:hypothetical protein
MREVADRSPRYGRPMPRLATLCLLLSLDVPSLAAASCGDPGAVPYEPRTFLGYACQADCGRHKAGLRWAERRAVTQPGECLSLTGPEAEGCAVYLDEGRNAEAAGERWAIENEVVHRCLCRGGGARFEAGCRRAVSVPAAASH